jgi:hypothetical protein
MRRRRRNPKRFAFMKSKVAKIVLAILAGAVVFYVYKKMKAAQLAQGPSVMPLVSSGGGGGGAYVPPQQLPAASGGGMSESGGGGTASGATSYGTGEGLTDEVFSG